MKCLLLKVFVFIFLFMVGLINSPLAYFSFLIHLTNPVSVTHLPCRRTTCPYFWKVSEKWCCVQKRYVLPIVSDYMIIPAECRCRLLIALLAYSGGVARHLCGSIAICVWIVQEPSKESLKFKKSFKKGVNSHTRMSILPQMQILLHRQTLHLRLGGH